MTYNSTTTLRRIADAKPCKDVWRKLLKGLGKKTSDEDPLPLLQVLDINGLDDALWVLSYAMPDDRLARHFQAWCVEQVYHPFLADRPDDTRIQAQIDMLRNDGASSDERDAARIAAWSIAGSLAGSLAGSAARAAAGSSSGSIAWAAARSSSGALAWTAEGPSSGPLAWTAEGPSSGPLAWTAARSLAWDAARADQERQLRKMIEVSQ